jgi:lambda repressor-like predicted transcriptional regulator
MRSTPGGLTIGELARRARLSPATLSAAIHSKSMNVRSAVALQGRFALAP